VQLNQPINSHRQSININQLTVHRVITPDDLITLNVPVLQGHAWFIFTEVDADGYLLAVIMGLSE